MCVHKLFIAVFLVFTFWAHAKVVTEDVEVEINFNDLYSTTDHDNEMLRLGKDLAISSLLKKNQLDVNSYFEKIKSLNLSPDEYDAMIAPFFKEVNLVKFSGIDPKSSIGQKLKGSLKTSIEESLLLEHYSDLLLDLKQFGKDAIYINTDLNLLNLESSDSSIFIGAETEVTKALFKTLSEEFRKEIKKELVYYEINDTYKNALKNFPKKFNSGSTELQIYYNLRKSSTSTFGKVPVEFSSYFILLNSVTRKTIYSNELKKVNVEISTIDSKKIPSIILTYMYQMIRPEIKKIASKFSDVAFSNKIEFKVSGQKMLSDILKLRDFLDLKLKESGISLKLSKIDLIESIIEFEGPSNIDLLKILKQLDKQSFSSSSSEQKVLFFDEVNKTFAIVKKD